MLSLFVLAFLLGTQAQTSHRIYSEFYAGADIITFKGSDIASQLSYASNLFFDPKSSNTTLWFTADESSPNVRSVGFDPTNPRGNFSFWLYSSSLPPQKKAAPFLSLVVLDNQNIIGSAYPSGDQQGIVIQSVLASAENFNVQVTSKPGYEFFSIVASSINTAVNTSTVYLAGWANDGANARFGFVVARGTARVNGAFGSVVISDDDISDPIVDFSCYDIFTTTNKPLLWLNSKETELLLAIPGRCSFFAKFVLPASVAPFSSIQPKTRDPTDTDLEFVSGLTLDKSTGVLWYALKKYNSDVATILSWDIIQWSPNSATIQIPFGEADMILSIGRQRISSDKEENWLFCLASGANTIYRISLGGNTAPTITGYASLPQRLSRVSSAVYVNPFIYFTTYEPTADVARIHFSSFCTYYCGNNSWCNNGVCDCEPQYSAVNAPNGTQLGCIPTVLHQGLILEQESSGAVAIMAVLFSFSIVMALAGWYSFYNLRNERMQYSSLVDANQGL